MNPKVYKENRRIQANVVKPHGRDHVWCLFIKFSTDVVSGKAIDEDKIEDRAKSWISQFARKEITSLSKQLKDTARRKDDNYKTQFYEDYDGGLVASFFISAKGNEYLGKPFEISDIYFEKGMDDHNNREVINDVPKELWEENYRRNFHAMIKLADNSLMRLNNKTNKIAKSLAKKDIGKILFIETGIKYRIGGLIREHFGYADGVSNPNFLNDSSAINNRPGMAERLFIPRKKGDNRKSSFLVFRKYEQNVFAFKQTVKRISQEVGIEEEYAGGQIIGRFKDGIPLSIKDNKGRIFFRFENNDTNDDSNGHKCPFHAHIRKTNPQTGRDKAKIFRQGITYGRRNPDFSDAPRKGVGLLFMSYQSQIGNFIQIQRACNDADKPKSATGIDPLIGQPKEITDSSKSNPYCHFWKKRWNRSKTKDVIFNKLKDDKGEPIEPLVTFKGGEYFYVPDIIELINLDEKFIYSNRWDEDKFLSNPDDIRDENRKNLLATLEKISNIVPGLNV